MKYSFFIFSLVFIHICFLFFSKDIYALGTFEVSNGYTPFIKFEKNPRLFRYFLEGKFQISSTGSINLNIFQKKNEIGFYTPWIFDTGTGNIQLSLSGKILSLPFEYTSSPKNTKDYDIFGELLPLQLQKRALSCEIAATSSLLSSIFGNSFSEEKIIELIPKSEYYNKLPKTYGLENYWGDPNTGFVGMIENMYGIEAKQKLMTGYGVYEFPISQVFQKYGLTTTIINNQTYDSFFGEKEHLDYILNALYKGNMVQLWGDWCTNPEFDDGKLESKKNLTQELAQNGVSAKNACYNWKEERKLYWYIDGENGEKTLHEGLDGEHAFILLGWKGEKENPTHIRVWDTDTGYHIYPLEEWMRKWEKMDFRSLIISRN